MKVKWVVMALATMVVMSSSASLASNSPRGGQAASVRIVLVGDSTVAEDSGWGPGFRRLAREGVEVINIAANGRSSRSFIDEGLWAKALAAHGQYLPDSVRPQRRAWQGTRARNAIRRQHFGRS